MVKYLYFILIFNFRTAIYWHFEAKSSTDDSFQTASWQAGTNGKLKYIKLKYIIVEIITINMHFLQTLSNSFQILYEYFMSGLPINYGYHQTTQ